MDGAAWPGTSPEESKGIMRALGAPKESAQTGRTVTLD